VVSPGSLVPLADPQALRPAPSETSAAQPISMALIFAALLRDLEPIDRSDTSRLPAVGEREVCASDAPSDRENGRTTSGQGPVTVWIASLGPPHGGESVNRYLVSKRRRPLADSREEGRGDSDSPRGEPGISPTAPEPARPAGEAAGDPSQTGTARANFDQPGLGAFSDHGVERLPTNDRTVGKDSRRIDDASGLSHDQATAITGLRFLARNAKETAGTMPGAHSRRNPAGLDALVENPECGNRPAAPTPCAADLPTQSSLDPRPEAQAGSSCHEAPELRSQAGDSPESQGDAPHPQLRIGQDPMSAQSERSYPGMRDAGHESPEGSLPRLPGNVTGVPWDAPDRGEVAFRAQIAAAATERPSLSNSQRLARTRGGSQRFPDEFSSSSHPADMLADDVPTEVDARHGLPARPNFADTHRRSAEADASDRDDAAAMPVRENRHSEPPKLETPILTPRDTSLHAQLPGAFAPQPVATGTRTDPKPAVPEPNPRAEAPETEPSNQRSVPAREIRLALVADDARVELRLTDRRGALDVAVRTPDHQLAERLRSELPTLSSRLESNGLSMQTCHPDAADRQTVREPASSRHREGQESGSRDQNQDRQQQGEQRRQEPQQQSRPQEKGRKFQWFLSATR